MKCLRNGQSKLIIISNNCPAIRKTQLEYMAILGGSKVLHFDGNNVELGKSKHHYEPNFLADTLKFKRCDFRLLTY